MSATKKISLSKKIGLWSGILAFLLIIFGLDLVPGKPEVTYTLAIAILMAIWWFTEALPVSITALLPVILFPFMGIINGKTIASTYFNHIIFLFIGGFILATAMEKWQLHKRIALRILMITGVKPGRILFGFMAATAFLSMWMSNTATAMMMVPIVLSLIAGFRSEDSGDEMEHFGQGLLLAVAYSASIGGLATLIGTPPNLAFVKIFNIMFPQAPEINFTQWMMLGLPISFFMFIGAWFLLYFMYRPKESMNIDTGDFKRRYATLGKMQFEEKVVLIVFIVLATLWITRSGIKTSGFNIQGWASLLPKPNFVNDGTIAIAITIFLFLIPSKQNKGEHLLERKAVLKLPWNIVLLFGGGFALAKGFADSGLSEWFQTQMQWVGNYPPILVIFSIALFMSFLTELTSNTATTAMFLPILAGMGVSAHIHPLLLMLPATFAASLAFMLPVATPPNAVVFGSNMLSIKQMAKTGFWLNMLGVVIITICIYFLASSVLGIDLSKMPGWAVMK